jgi:D-sedoheptulose 7-phosphate isomerase
MIRKTIQESIALKERILADNILLEKIENTANLAVEMFRKDGKMLFCGNGGSAADAQHIAAELSGRFYMDRKPLFAEALHVNASYLTAVANDYGYDQVYSRMVAAAGKKGDILVAISTSGNSKNITLAAEKAKMQGMIVIGLTGKNGGNLAEFCDILINVPSTDTPRIQEAHILIGHILCEIIESELFKKITD